MLPPALFALTKKADFWRDYFFDYDPVERSKQENPYSDLGDVQLSFPVSPAHPLYLRCHSKFTHLNIGLSGVAGDLLLGYSGICPIPHALRWSELDLFCRNIALLDPSLPHPGLPLLFLCHFAPICLGDNVDAIFPLLEQAWRSLALDLDATMTRSIEHIDGRRALFTWKHQEHFGWYITQHLGQPHYSSLLFHMRPYSFRQPEKIRASGSRVFPVEELEQTIAAAEDFQRQFARDLRAQAGGAALALAEQMANQKDLGRLSELGNALQKAGCDHPTLLRACEQGSAAEAWWVLELLLEAPRGSLLAAAFGPSPRQVAPRWVAQFSIPGLHKNDWDIIDRVDQRLRKLQIGEAHTNIFDKDPSSHALVVLFDHLEAGLHALATILRQAGAPSDTVIGWYDPELETRPLVEFSETPPV